MPTFLGLAVWLFRKHKFPESQMVVNGGKKANVPIGQVVFKRRGGTNSGPGKSHH